LAAHWARRRSLVNAAGGNDPKATVTAEQKFENIPVANWASVFDLNLGRWRVSAVPGIWRSDGAARTRVDHQYRQCLRHLPLSRVVAYSAAKAAVVNLTQFLAREWARNGVRVNSITPGFFPAEQNRALLFNKDGSPTPRAQSILAIRRWAGLGRRGNCGA